MSGGSFNYLYLVDSWDVRQRIEDLKSMATFLEKCGESADLTKELITLLEEQDREVNEKIEKLKKTWKATEWWVSGDIDENRFRKIIKDEDVRS